MKHVFTICVALGLATAVDAAPVVMLDFSTSPPDIGGGGVNPTAGFDFLSYAQITFDWAGTGAGTAALTSAEAGAYPEHHPGDDGTPLPTANPLGAWQLTTTGTDLLEGFTVLLPTVPDVVYGQGVYFDTEVPGDDVVGTSLGGAGLSFTYDASSPELSGEILVTYDLPQVSISLPDVDQWREMAVDLTGLTGGGMGAGVMTFFQDVDTVFPPDDPPPVPLPASVLLLSAACAGLISVRKTRKA